METLLKHRARLQAMKVDHEGACKQMMRRYTMYMIGFMVIEVAGSVYHLYAIHHSEDVYMGGFNGFFCAVWIGLFSRTWDFVKERWREYERQRQSLAEMTAQIEEMISKLRELHAHQT